MEEVWEGSAMACFIDDDDDEDDDDDDDDGRKG